MAWPYEAYVTLLTDLLSQNELPQGSLASIAEQVGTVEDAGLGRLVSAMLQSPTLYGQASQYQASTSSKPAEYVELAAAQNVFHAVRQGVDNRVQQLKKSKGHTWAKRRKLQKTLQHAHDVISECANNGDAASSAKALVLWVAILRGIQDHCVRKDALFKSESSIVQTCERHAISSIFQHITYLPALASKQLPDGKPEILIVSIDS